MSDYYDGCKVVRTLDRERLASLWQDTAFNDVILVVECLEEPRQKTLRIPAHKAVLAAASQYFHKMFTSASLLRRTSGRFFSSQTTSDWILGPWRPFSSTSTQG